MSARRSVALWIVIAMLALLCAIFLWRVLATIGLLVPLDPNEGWNAYHAAAAMSGAPLYPGGYMLNNYPPLSFYIVGGLGRAIGDNIIAGRILSLVGFFGTALGIIAAMRAMGSGGTQAVFAALLFAACLLLTSDYAGMDDPQLLGHAIGIAGFIILLQEPRGWRSVIAAASFFVLAGFVKHNLAVQPLAMTIWLFVYDRRNAWRFMLCGIAFLIAGLIAFRLVYGTDILVQLDSARVYSFHNLVANLSDWLWWGYIPILGLGILFWLHRRDKYVALCVLYACIAIVTGAIFLGGDGVDVNAMFDADIALAIGAGLALDRFAARNAAALLYALPVALALWRSADPDWRDPDFWIHPLAEETQTSYRDIAFLNMHRGPALCEMLSLCYWAGKRAEVDVFNVGQQFLTGARSDDEIVRLIGQRYFRTLQFDSLMPFALTPRIREAVLRNYRIDHANDDGVFSFRVRHARP